MHERTLTLSTSDVNGIIIRVHNHVAQKKHAKQTRISAFQVPPPLDLVLATSPALAEDASAVAPTLVARVPGLEELAVELDLVAEVAALRGRRGRRALVVDAALQEAVGTPGKEEDGTHQLNTQRGHYL